MNISASVYYRTTIVIIISSQKSDFELHLLDPRLKRLWIWVDLQNPLKSFFHLDNDVALLNEMKYPCPHVLALIHSGHCTLL